jgi:hypothetical protein
LRFPPQRRRREAKGYRCSRLRAKQQLNPGVTRELIVAPRFAVLTMTRYRLVERA